MKRTRLSVCRRKVRYATREEAMAAALAGGWVLRPYRCDRAPHYHLTSRRRGHHTPLAVQQALLPGETTSGSEETVL